MVLPGPARPKLVRQIAAGHDYELARYCYADLTILSEGESEKNIVRVFRQAERCKSFLFIDEADSLFQDRRNAKFHWQICKVEELLAAMGHYSGIFCCATGLHLKEQLDPKVMSRFHFKFAFDYLGAAEIDLLFRRFFEPFWTRTPRRKDLDAARKCDRLAPGDFKAVASRLQLQGKRHTVTNLVGALLDEVAAKEPLSITIKGFGSRSEATRNL